MEGAVGVGRIPSPTVPGAHQGGELTGHDHVVVRVEVEGRWAHWHASCLECSWSGSERDSHAEALADAEAHAYGSAPVRKPVEQEQLVGG